MAETSNRLNRNSELTMEIPIPYGDEQIPINVPDEHLQGVLMPNQVGELRPEAEIVASALQHPIQAPCLEEIVAAGDRVVVVIPDKTRRSRLEFVLPLLLGQLHDLRIRCEDILLLFANGSHAAMTTTEKRTLLGEAIFSTYLPPPSFSTLFLPVCVSSKYCRQVRQ